MEAEVEVAVEVVVWQWRPVTWMAPASSASKSSSMSENGGLASLSSRNASRPDRATCTL